MHLTAKDSDDSGVGDNTASDISLPVSSISEFFVPEIEVENYQAIDSYKADGPGQISFEAGDTIQVVDKLEDGMSEKRSCVMPLDSMRVLVVLVACVLV